MASSTSSDSSREDSRPNVKPESTCSAREKRLKRSSSLGSFSDSFQISSSGNPLRHKGHSSPNAATFPGSLRATSTRSQEPRNRRTPASTGSPLSDSSVTLCVSGRAKSNASSSPRSPLSDSSLGFSVRSRFCRGHSSRYAPYSPSPQSSGSPGASAGTSSSVIRAAQSSNDQLTCLHCDALCNDLDMLAMHMLDRQLNNGICGDATAAVAAPAVAAPAVAAPAVAAPAVAVPAVAAPAVAAPAVAAPALAASAEAAPAVAAPAMAAPAMVSPAVADTADYEPAPNPRVEAGEVAHGEPVEVMEDHSLFVCHYCSIGFSDRALFCLHMGLHNLNNPWQCNMCGEVCSGCLDFTSHVLHN